MGTTLQRKLQAEVGDRKIDLILDRNTVSIDDRQVRYSHERLSERHLSLIVDGRSYSVVVIPDGDNCYRVVVEGREFTVHLKDERDLLLERFGLAEAAASGTQSVRAPMPGLVLSVSVEPGQEVRKGAGLAVLEAMKMENELRAETDGTIKAVHVAPGNAVGKSDLLFEIESL